MKKNVHVKHESENEEGEIYKIQAQFQDVNINVLNSETITIFKNIKDLETISKIMDELIKKENESQRIESRDKEPYTILELKKLLKQRQLGSSSTTTQDLLLKINNLKEEIINIKNNIKDLEDRISILEKGKTHIS